MEMPFLIGGVGLAFVTAIVAVVVHARRRRNNDRARAVALQETHRRAGEDTRVAARWEAQQPAEEKARAAKLEAERRVAEEARHRTEEEARAAAEQKAQRQAEATRRRSQKEARAAEALEAQRQTDENARAEEKARAGPEWEAQRRNAEDEARAVSEREVQRQAEQIRRRTEEETGAVIKPEALRQAEETRAAVSQAQGSLRVAPGDDRSAPDGEAETCPPQAVHVGPAARDDTPEVLRAPVGATGSVMGTPSQVAPLAEPVAPPPLAPRAPRQYRPTGRAPSPQRTLASLSSARVARERAMPIEVRLVFEKAGFCRVSLLPRRAPGMPAEFAIQGSGSPPELLALQDEWYQDVILPDIGHLLREGIDWTGALSGGTAGRLSLSGRSIFVLAQHGELNGFVSTPRLVLGNEHVVLCGAERLPDVRQAIALTGSPEPTELNSDCGIPAGWVALRGVCPKKPIAPSPGGDTLDALRPLPDVEIALTGGIRLDRQAWLSGFPPTVELLGDTTEIGVVTIDGQEATRSAEGGYVAPGWDAIGEHTVWCTSRSRTYAIRNGAEVWEPWSAYAWSLGEPTASGMQARPSICGVLVYPPRVARAGSHPTVAAASNPILIGARPGEIVVCMPRADVCTGLCIGFPWFEPIWAIPADALHCDKHTTRVLLIGPPLTVDRGDHEPRAHGGGGRAARRRALASVSHAWCAAILAASRKGLQIEPSRVDIADLWKSYRRCAKALQRGWR